MGVTTVTLKGLPILIAILLVILNFLVQIIPVLAWLAGSNLLLHLGIIIGLGGNLVGDIL